MIHLLHTVLTLRSIILGDIVRRNGKEELGTVLSLESRATVRVLETNNHLSSICGNRLGTFY